MTTGLFRRLPAWLLILLLWPLNLWALDVPPLKGRINDYARMLSAQAVRHLDTVLTDLERTDSTQIVVLTVPSLEGDPLEDFSIRVVEKWGIGQKGMDNGALLLIVKNDRKIRIEVGYGLEGKLTDLVSGRIIRNVITPQFKMGRFDQGVLDGVTAMTATVRGAYTAVNRTQRDTSRRNGGSPGVFVLFVLLILLRVVGRVNRGMGAVAGGVIAPIVGLLFLKAGLLWALLLIPIGALGGFLMGMFGSALSHSHTAHRSRGTTFWGGGFSGGGFSSGGGFGGFSGGGGGFGGGGASGGW